MQIYICTYILNDRKKKKLSTYLKKWSHLGCVK